MANGATLVTAFAELLKSAAWPLVAVVILCLYRRRIHSLVDVVTKKLDSAKSVKAGQFEFELTEQKVQEVLAGTTRTASNNIQDKIPDEQIQAADELEKFLQAGQVSAMDVVYPQVQRLVVEYELLRELLASGDLRTRRMNEVAAKMRALGLAARPLLRTLSMGLTPGERLAAICLLQVAPEYGYFDWLIQRIKSEQQPFIFFQAAIAIWEMVKAKMYPNQGRIKAEIEDAKKYISNFKGGVPDKNTINVLDMALDEL